MLRGLFDLLKTNYLIVYDRIWGVLVTAVKESEQRNELLKKQMCVLQHQRGLWVIIQNFGPVRECKQLAEGRLKKFWEPSKQTLSVNVLPGRVEKWEG